MQGRHFWRLEPAIAARIEQLEPFTKNAVLAAVFCELLLFPWRDESDRLGAKAVDCRLTLHGAISRSPRLSAFRAPGR